MVTGWWKDTGRPEDLLEANRMLLETLESRTDGDVDAASTIEGTCVVGPGAIVRRSQVIGPVVIGPGAVIEGSRVGPHVSLEANARISGSTIVDSIVMEECVVQDVRGLAGSILGRAVVVRHSGVADVHRLVVGDQSQVEVD
jgi:glucose-1-phosphate thymidylyltransferase